MEWTYSLRQTQQANKTLRYRRLLALPQELFRDQSVGQLNDTVSLPTVMYSPFERGGDACYSGVAPDLMEVIEKFNEAADRAVGQTEGCIVCLDTLGTPEGDPPPRSLLTNGTAGASGLSMVTLQCGSRRSYILCPVQRFITSIRRFLLACYLPSVQSVLSSKLQPSALTVVPLVSLTPPTRFLTGSKIWRNEMIRIPEKKRKRKKEKNTPIVCPL